MTTARTEILGRIGLLNRQLKDAQEDAVRYAEASAKATSDAENIARLINEYSALIDPLTPPPGAP